MTEQELREFLDSHYPVEDEKCDWKEMKNLKNSFNGHEGEDVMSEEQKKNKIKNLLYSLAKSNVIKLNEKRQWVLREI